MKTKDKVKKTSSRGATESRSWEVETNRKRRLSNYSPGGGRSLIDFSTPQLLDFSTSEIQGTKRECL
jgi:hypothetical protein